MSTKEQVLKTLELHRGESLSGEELARKLGISRAAVWKAVKALEKDGHNINAATNRGYSLSQDSDVLTAQGIQPHLELPDYAGRIHVFPSLESTNKTAKEMAADGAPHGTTVLADGQTAGRGRYGRSFYSPQGSGLYMSIVLRAPFPLLSSATMVTAAAAVSVCRAVSEITGFAPGIKWVNDVFLEGKKICGILTEAMTDFESGGIDWLVVGMGVNITQNAFPEELRHIAGSIFEQKADAGIRNRLAACIMNRMLPPGGLDDREFMPEYKKRLIMLGKEVTVIGHGESFQATALDVDNQGHLIVRRADGTTETLSSGEVSVRL